MPSHWPNAVMRLQHDIGVIEFTGNPEKIIRSLLNLIESASVDIEDRQIGDGRRRFSELWSLRAILAPRSTISSASSADHP
jgi:hypothetical protein